MSPFVLANEGVQSAVQSARNRQRNIDLWEWRPSTVAGARLRAQYRRRWRRLDGALYPVPGRAS